MAKNPRLIDLTGQRFGRWTVLEQAGNSPRGVALWRARCDCGTVGTPTGTNLRKGISRSCGCAGSRATAGDRTRTHGETGSRLHRIWGNMRKRCRNPRTPGYENYGGRGIAICPEWDDFTAFRDWALKAGYAPELSIERKDVDGNYEPTNCVWATPLVQSANRRFTRKRADGRLWWHIAQEHGITNAAFRTRLFDGWPVEQAATWPMRRRRP